MTSSPQLRYKNHIEYIRRMSKSIEKNPEAVISELKRTADYLESQFHVIFPDAEGMDFERSNETPPHLPLLYPEEKTMKTASKSDRGFYFKDLYTFLTYHSPAQISKDIVPYLKKIYGSRINTSAVRKTLKRAHWNPKSLIMRSPIHPKDSGTYMLARSIDEKQNNHRDVFTKKK